MAMELKLPEKPVDRFELKCWSVDEWGMGHHVTEHRYVYHVKSTWAEVVPREKWLHDTGGAPFEDEWQHFSGGDHFDGRVDKWLGLRPFTDRMFATFEEALREAIIRGLRNVRRHEAELAKSKAAVFAYLAAQDELMKGMDVKLAQDLLKEARLG